MLLDALPRRALLWGALALAAALYWRHAGLALLKSPEQVELGLHAHRQASDTVIRWLGRAFFLLASAAWLVMGAQSAAAAIERYRYVGTAAPPLQPLDEDQQRQQLQEEQARRLARQQQQQQQQQRGRAEPDSTAAAAEERARRRQAAADASQAAASAAAAQGAAAAAASSSAAAQAAQRSRQERAARDARVDAARSRALEAAQRALDEQAAARKAQQEQEAAERKARAARAAELAAQKAAEQAAAAEAVKAAAQARAAAQQAELDRRRALWHQAVQDQWHGLAPPARSEGHDSEGAAPGAAAAGAAAPAAGAAPAAAAAGGADAASAAADRRLREMQDEEFAASLERDRALHAARAAKAAAVADAEAVRAKRQRLAALRLSLQQRLGAAGADADADAGAADTLTLRVRLPDGSNIVRRFSCCDALDAVFDWVYSQAAMPLWVPGTWRLVSSFPRRQLVPPLASLWAPGGWERHEAAQEGEEEQQQQAAGGGGGEQGSWLLEVRPLQGEVLFVRVTGGTRVGEVKAGIQAQSGLPPEAQRLIFGGRILSDAAQTLHQCDVGPGCSLQLATRLSGGGGSGSIAAEAGAAGAAGPSAAAGGAAAAAAPGHAQALAAAQQHAYLGSGEALVVSDVQQLKAQVAHGAAQLALFVEASWEQEPGGQAGGGGA